MAVVYGLTRVSDSTIRYVGVTTATLEARFKTHQAGARKGIKRPVYDWMRKYDDVVAVVIHDGLANDEAFEIEKLEIAKRDNLLNVTAGGEGTLGFRRTFTKEHRAKMSLAKKGKPHSAEHNANISLAKQQISAETREKLSVAAKAQWARKRAEKQLAQATAEAS